MENISDVKLVPLVDSGYVKPMRMLYKQDGVSKVWDLVKLHDSVAIIIFHTERKKLIFVKQFRPAVYFSCLPDGLKTVENGYISSFDDVTASDGITLELCAGIVDKTQDVVKTAQGEVLEECGYDVPLSKFEKVTCCRSGVGVSGDEQTIFYVEVNDSMKVSEGGGLVSEGEMIDVVEMSVAEAEDWLKKPKINSPSGFLFAIMWFLHNKAVQHTSL